MKNLKTQENLNIEPAVDEADWQPEVLDGSANHVETPVDLDLAEVWYWFHSRLKALGDLDHDNARLMALLTWNEATVSRAVYAARLEVNQLEDEGVARRSHLEYLAAEYMARLVLKNTAIPAPELRSA